MTNEQAISEIKDLIVYTLEKKEALKMAIKALEQSDNVKIVTKDNIRDWWSNNSKNSPEGLDGRMAWTNSDVFNFAKDHGILIEESKKVKKYFWDYTHLAGLETRTKQRYSEDEMKKFYITIESWKKDESSMIEVDE